MRSKPFHFIWMSAAALFGGCAGQNTAPPSPTVQPALPDFAQTRGWIGADGASSIDLNDGRSLWLFGDTFVGALNAEGGCAEGTRMVNNTIGVQLRSAEDQPGAMSFHWGPVRDAQATSWAVSPAAFGPAASTHWMWPAGGGIRTGDGDADQVVLFFMMMRRRDASNSVWNFQQHGTAAVTIYNPRDPIAKWRTEISPLRDHEPAMDAGEPVRMITWGPSVIADAGSPDHVLVYGVDVSNGRDKRLVLARAPRATLTRFETWEFRTADGWSNNEPDAAPLAAGLVDEFSVSPITIGEQPVFMMTQTEPNLGTRILVRFADHAHGPWSDGHPVFTCPEPAQDSRLFVYSAKAHPELAATSADGWRSIPVTYCVNSSDFPQVLKNVAIYRPRFIRLERSDIESAREQTRQRDPGRSR